MRKLVFAAAGAVAFVGSPAMAQTATTDFDVLLTVENSCSVEADDLNFGNSTVVGTSAVTGSSEVRVTCTPGADYSIALGDGDNYSSGRNMSDGTNSVPYGLFQDSGHATVWNSSTTVDSTGTGAEQSFAVYGQIPASASPVPAASYTDSVAVTVSY